MKPSYFKPRKSFSFSAHQFDLGTFIGLWHSHDDNHFLLKIYRMDDKEYSDYCNYHLNYTLENNLVSEEDFFRHVGRSYKLRSNTSRYKIPFLETMLCIGSSSESSNSSKNT